MGNSESVINCCQESKKEQKSIRTLSTPWTTFNMSTPRPPSNSHLRGFSNHRRSTTSEKVEERIDWDPLVPPCEQDDTQAPVVVEARNFHTITVIMLHGIGDSGKGWASIADDVDLPHAKWMFPSAKVRPLTAKLGKPTSAWADVNILSIEGPDDEQGTMETKDMIHRLIAEEVRRGIPAHRIFIGGFSQGGAMACVATLTHKQQLAGCFVLSGYMTMHKTLPFLLTDEGRRTPFFQAHGEDDRTVPLLFGQASSQLIRSLGVTCDFKSYPRCCHSTCPQEMADLTAFLSSHSSPSAPPLPRTPRSQSDVVVSVANAHNAFERRTPKRANAHNVLDDIRGYHHVAPLPPETASRVASLESASLVESTHPPPPMGVLHPLPPIANPYKVSQLDRLLDNPMARAAIISPVPLPLPAVPAAPSPLPAAPAAPACQASVPAAYSPVSSSSQMSTTFLSHSELKLIASLQKKNSLGHELPTLRSSS